MEYHSVSRKLDQTPQASSYHNFREHERKPKRNLTHLIYFIIRCFRCPNRIYSPVRVYWTTITGTRSVSHVRHRIFDYKLTGLPPSGVCYVCINSTYIALYVSWRVVFNFFFLIHWTKQDFVIWLRTNWTTITLYYQKRKNMWHQFSWNSIYKSDSFFKFYCITTIFPSNFSHLFVLLSNWILNFTYYFLNLFVVTIFRSFLLISSDSKISNWD